MPPGQLDHLLGGGLHAQLLDRRERFEQGPQRGDVALDEHAQPPLLGLLHGQPAAQGQPFAVIFKCHAGLLS